MSAANWGIVSREAVHLDILELDGAGGCLGSDEDGEGNESSDAGCYSGEVAEDILRADQRGMHGDGVREFGAGSGVG